MGKRYQVVIVGGGPVGVGLAVDLGLRGVSCLLVERRVGLQRIPKGQNLTQRTLEHFYFWGIVEELRAKRLLPKSIPASGIVAYGNLMSEHWHAVAGREVVGDYYFQANDRLPQYHMEEVLRTRLAGLASVESRYGSIARTLVQDPSSVRITIADESSGAEETIEADYVVGCDGGHSTVREQVGIERGGTDFDQIMLLAVFRSRALHEGFKRFPPRSTYRAMNPALNGYWQFFGRIDVDEGWFFHSPVPAGTTRENFDAHGLIQQVAGFEFAAEFDHIGFWDLRVAVAERYQVGRVFIAGDAAHSHPPYGGYGLNNGLEDAVNLGWKLHARLAGWGSDALLHSYSEERRPVFKETGEDFIASRIAMEGKFLATYAPDRDRVAFERAWEALKGDAGARAMTYEPNYEGSPVVYGPPGAKSSAHGTHAFKARPGHHLPPQKLSWGRNVFEELGRGYTLLAFDADDATVAAFEKGAARFGAPFKVIRDSYADGRERYEARLVLVRPDQYVVWTDNPTPAHAGPLNASSVMAKVIGR